MAQPTLLADSGPAATGVFGRPIAQSPPKQSPPEVPSTPPADRTAASNLMRLLRKSNHVGDLRLIAGGSIAVGVLVLAGPVLLHFAGDDLQHALIAAIIGSIAAVMAWAYREGNARLGIVDLFASEIGTLCRVCAVVDLVDGYTKLYDDPTIKLRDGASEESYTVIFDNNSDELKVLERGTVGDVTAFYTYLRASRDGLRNLVRMQSRPEAPSLEEWRGAVQNLIYMFFLALESGRLAITKLTDDDHSRTDDVISVLLSEIPAFDFLLRRLDEDNFRRERILLRGDAYDRLVPDFVGRGLMQPWSRMIAAELARRWQPVADHLADLRKSAAAG
jgi:hypothetical protein